MSSFTWLDYDERERRKMLDIVSMFSERETRDELGIGSIRDAFADMLFPGTSTIQTRARYFLFIPWMYQRLERARTKSANIRDVARQEEIRLINIIEGSDDADGNIGRLARAGLQRLPSNIYWLGLDRWGIRLYKGSQDQYHRSLDAFYAYRERGTRHAEDGRGDLVGSHYAGNWDPGIPEPPADFPKQASMRLLPHEAVYLRERLQFKASDSLLAFLVTSCSLTSWPETPWMHPQFTLFPSHIQEQLFHARNFAEIIHGAALLYNLMLAQKRGVDNWIDAYKNALNKWIEAMQGRLAELQRWNITQFWLTSRQFGAHISTLTVQFVERWINIALQPARLQTIATDSDARNLIHQREQFLKRGLARLDNQRSLDLWSGAAGAAALQYRWPTAWRIVSDIQEGLIKAGTYA